MSRMPGSILMVGSIPLETPEEVFRACGKYVGPYVACLPDGEIFPRTLWIGYLARYVYDGHPDVITDQALPTEREQGGASGGHNPATKWRFRLKPGAGAPRFETGYADFALESYETFQKLRDEGACPKDVRFQVCFPTTGAGFISYFEDTADWPAMAEAYRDAFGRDIARILDRIPADDLAIQLDFCPEIRDIQDALPWSPPLEDNSEGKFEMWVDGVVRLADMVPEDALLGLHWCYGTMGGWPMIRLDDLGLCTRLTNAAVAQIARPVDYVHMPVLRHAEEAYFAPLGGLEPRGAKVYLGLLHHTDDVATNMGRIDTARKHLAGDMGVASVCGYGRLSPEDTQKAFELHAAVGAELGSG